MSLYDDASLIMYPSGYKANKIYSLKPTDGSGDFDFTRASTATRTNESGLIESVASGVPRIDYTGGGCGKLLLEPQRTNSLLQSNQFDTTWSATNTVLTSSQNGVGGSTDAWKLQSNSNSSESYIRQNSSLSGTSVVTLYAKKGSANFLGIYIGSISPDISVSFDLNNGVVGDANNAIETDIKNVGNGWYRCTIVGSDMNQNVNFYVTDANGSFLSNDGSYIYIQYAQLEQGSYPTSYIPSAGATATRVAETATGAGDVNTFNDSEGVLMVEISALEDDGTFRNISLSDGTTSNRFLLQYTNVSNLLRVETFTSSGTAPSVLSTTLSSVENNTKIAFKYKANDFSLWVNGIEVDSIQVGDNPINLSRLGFDSGTGLANFYGNTKQIQYFPTALTDAKLEEITSWTSFIEMAQAQNYKTY